LQFVPCPLGRVLYQSGQTIDYAYFPDDCVISLLATLENGRSVEVTLAAGIFRKAGLIQYTRGKIKLLNTKALEFVACECYRVDHAAIRSE